MSPFGGSGLTFTIPNAVSRRERARADVEWMKHEVKRQIELEAHRQRELDQLYQDEAARIYQRQEAQWEREREARERLMHEVGHNGKAGEDCGF